MSRKSHHLFWQRILNKKKIKIQQVKHLKITFWLEDEVFFLSNSTLISQDTWKTKKMFAIQQEKAFFQKDWKNHILNLTFHQGPIIWDKLDILASLLKIAAVVRLECFFIFLAFFFFNAFFRCLFEICFFVAFLSFCSSLFLFSL